MAYRPPSQSRYAAVTAPPPPGPFSGRRQQQQQQPQEDDWITPVPRKRRDPYPPAPAPTPVTTPTPSTMKPDDFPVLGAPSMPKKTWGSNESMAERMKKKMEEEELEQLEKEKRKESEKKNASTTEFIPTNIITHKNLMRRFKEEDENAYEDDYEGGLDTDVYGREYESYDYRAHTPDYGNETGDQEDEWS